MSPILGIIASGQQLSASSSFNSIATATGTGSSGIINFTSIPSTYKHLQLRIIARNNNAASSIGDSLMYFGNGSPDTGSNYTTHRLSGNGTTASAYGNAPEAQLTIYGTEPNNLVTANVYGVAIVDILDYSSSSKFKTMRELSGTDANGSGTIALASGLWRSTSVIDYIRISSSANFLTSTTIALYGIAG